MSDKFRPSLPTIKSSYYGVAENHSSIRERIEDILGTSSATLPMYKDKPTKPIRPFKTAKKRNVDRIAVILIVLFGIAWFSGMLRNTGRSFYNPDSKDESAPDATVWKHRKEAVKTAFTTSWEYYAQHAWGMDEFHPVSQNSRNMGCKNPNDRPLDACAPTGWIIVDALDTAMIMNLTDKVAQARNWISTSLDFNKVDSEMSTFETTIRVLGGLLSAHYLSTTFPSLAPVPDDDVGAKGEDLYIEKAVDLADKLLGAFDTKTGIPLSSCILNTSVGVGDNGNAGAASTAEATTLQLEFKYVAKLTGEPLYWEKAERVMEVVDAPRHPGNILPIFINPATGDWQGSNIRVGSRGDSYYEYLIKQYLQTGSRETVYLDMWDEAVEGMKQHLITWSKNGNFTILAERPSGLGNALVAKMDHLVCFLPGTILLGLTRGATLEEARKLPSWGKQQEQDVILAEELAKTCRGMYEVTPTKLAPEITYFVVDNPPRAWNTTDSDWEMPRSVELDSDKDAPWRSDYDIHKNDVHNLQRPETIESLFYMWRITGNVKYREWGWQIFKSFLAHTAIYSPQGKVVGYTSIQSVHKAVSIYSDRLIAGTKTAKRDNMEGFWLAETLKYLYLLFDDDVHDWSNLEKIVFNTEAHILPRFDIGSEGKIWKTGWTRKERPLAVQPSTVDD